MPTLQLHESFFEMVRERYRIKLRRDSGQPWPWSEDKVFQDWRFTNVFREDDKTTTWFRENVRRPVCADIQNTDLDVVTAIMIFRWFNRITTGEIIKDMLVRSPHTHWDREEAERRLKDVRPLVTGAYMIKTHNDMNKLDGILLSIDNALPKLVQPVNSWRISLEQAWKNLVKIDFIGGFMAHEIVQDLRYTYLLCDAPDKMTWTHLGPGAIRGMSWMLYENEHTLTGSPKQQREVLAFMYELLAMSRESRYWPSEWPGWELHQVEFALCEFSKYQKAKRGIPQKRRYSRGEDE